MSSTQGGVPGRFTPNGFQYNGRVALALVPCLLVTAFLGGRPVLATMTVGSMLAYLMDALQYRDGAFTCSWLTMLATDVAFIVSIFTTSSAPVWILIMMIFVMNATMAVMGMWVSLQFKWIQLQHPSVALLFEHAVVTASLPVAAVHATLGLASVVGSSEVPYYLAVILVVLYTALGQPLASSFYGATRLQASGSSALGGGGYSKKEALKAAGAIVQTKIDGFLMALLTCTLPPLLYGAIHAVLLGKAVHVYSVVLLAALPLLYIALLPGGLWWLPGPPRLVFALQWLLICTALFAFLVAFEGRVVFYAFRQYIKLHPPWDWIAVTVAMFGCASVCLAYQLGAVGSLIDVTIAGSLLLLCSTSGALAVGIPFHWLPAPLIGACGLALFFDSHHFREYIFFAGGTFMTGVWFVHHHFWFLDIKVGDVHLQTLCKLVIAALVPAIMIPGLVFARAPRAITTTLLLLQAALLAVLEEQLYVPSHSDFAGEVMYPGYLVVATSALGLLAARQLAGPLQPLASWALHCLYGGKLAMVALPEARLVMPAVVLAAAISAPMFFYGQDKALPSKLPHQSGANGSPAGSGMSPPPAPRLARRLRIAPWQGLAHVISVVAAVGLARFALFDIVQYLTGGRPSEGILLGTLVLVAAAGCMPLITRCYVGNQMVVRAVALAVMGGALLVLLQPPLPIKGGARCPDLPLSLCPRLWDERHIPLRSVEDVEIWGTGLGRKEHWPRWLLIVAVMMAMLAATANSAGSGPANTSMQGRISFATTAGLLLGSYIALEVVPGQVVLQILVILSSICVVAFVAVLQRPAGVTGLTGAPLWLPLLPGAWTICAALTMMLQTELPPPAGQVLNQRLFPDNPLVVEAEVFQATRASLLGVFAAHSLLLAFAMKLKVAAVLRGRGERSAVGGSGDAYLPTRLTTTSSDFFCSIVPAGVYQQFGRMLKLPGAAGLALSRLQQQDLGWLPTMGNVCTLLAFAIGLALNAYMTGGASEAIFLLAPLLLLLSQDPVLLPGLGEAQRYCPSVAAIAGFLAASSIWETLQQAGLGGLLEGDIMLTGQHPLLHIAFNAALTAAALPTQYLFMHYMWTQRSGSTLVLLAAAPLNLLPLVLADVLPAKYLAAFSLGATLLQFFAMKHAAYVGMRVI